MTVIVILGAMVAAAFAAFMIVRDRRLRARSRQRSRYFSISLSDPAAMDARDERPR